MIKMLTSASGKNSKGADISVQANESTDLFSKEEEERYIEKGLAERVGNSNKHSHNKSKNKR